MTEAFALLDLPEELIVRIMEALPTRDLLNVSRVRPAPL